VTGTLGQLTRADGTSQVTYNGMPLYGWKNDTKAGDVTGQGINSFLVAKP
jgi:predicted lipoprotein with Yx(FWY)xxD motif